MSLTPFGYFDLLDAMQEKGCPVCTLLTRDANKLLNTILYEYVTEPQTHAEFRASLGLCNVHGWQLTEQGNVMSIAVLYSAVVDEAFKQSDDIETPRMRGLFNRNSNHALDPDAPCPACKKIDENEARYISVFADKLDDDRLLNAFKTSDGLCVDHFKQVTSLDAPPEFVAVQREKWQSLYAELQEFIRKYDPTKADSAIGEEGDSWLRAVRDMAGGQGVFGRRSKP